MSKAIKTLGVVGVLVAVSGCTATAVGTSATATGASIAQERSLGNAIDDAGIQATINSNFIQKDVNHLFTKVGVEVVEGRVLLTGAVFHPEHRVEAVKQAWLPKGVKEVINEIQITSNPVSPKQIAVDSWITSQIKAKYLATRGLRSINYNVETVNNVVYLLGIAQSREELDVATQIASKIKGVDKVISHVRLKNDPLRVQ